MVDQNPDTHPVRNSEHPQKRGLTYASYMELMASNTHRDSPATSQADTESPEERFDRTHNALQSAYNNLIEFRKQEQDLRKSYHYELKNDPTDLSRLPIGKLHEMHGDFLELTKRYRSSKQTWVQCVKDWEKAKNGISSNSAKEIKIQEKLEGAENKINELNEFLDKSIATSINIKDTIRKLESNAVFDYHKIDKNACQITPNDCYKVKNDIVLTKAAITKIDKNTYKEGVKLLKVVNKEFLRINHEIEQEYKENCYADKRFDDIRLVVGHDKARLPQILLEQDLNGIHKWADTIKNKLIQQQPMLIDTYIQINAILMEITRFLEGPFPPIVDAQEDNADRAENHVQSFKTTMGQTMQDIQNQLESLRAIQQGQTDYTQPHQPFQSHQPLQNTLKEIKILYNQYNQLGDFLPGMLDRAFRDTSSAGRQQVGVNEQMIKQLKDNIKQYKQTVESQLCIDSLESNPETSIHAIEQSLQSYHVAVNNLIDVLDPLSQKASEEMSEEENSN